MIGYLTLGTNDLVRAAAFYDGVLALLGAKRGMETERYVGWVAGPGTPMLMAIKPFDGQPATPGNGTMIGLAAASRQQVEAVHAKALALGARDEGAVGPRGDSFYGGYFRDLDGNKLVVFCMG
jgi:catechol 2,3-dioxygenase-like lactoylglutathione lyase family enzyme